ETPLQELLTGAGGTRFAAADSAPAFKLWLRHGKRVAGTIAVDAGARRAILEKGASLLAAGITEATGSVRAGAGGGLGAPDGAPAPTASRSRAGSQRSTQRSSTVGRRRSRLCTAIASSCCERARRCRDSAGGCGCDRGGARGIGSTAAGADAQDRSTEVPRPA